jgi:hypothetical protein
LSSARARGLACAVSEVAVVSSRLLALKIWVLCLTLWIAALLPADARAQVAIGPHAGLNLDVGSVHLGGDVIVQLSQLSETVSLGIWPSYAHVLIDGGHDVELFGVDFPFMFRLEDSIVTPFAAPGLGLAFYGDTALKVNLIGGVFLEAGGGVRPFTELAIRLVNGTYVDLLFGVVFEL